MQPDREGGLWLWSLLAMKGKALPDGRAAYAQPVSGVVPVQSQIARHWSFVAPVFTKMPRNALVSEVSSGSS